MKKFVIASACALFAVAASASDVVGELRDVQGAVTVASNGEVVKAVNGTKLTATSRVLVANGGKASIMMKDGCLVPLKANQQVTLNPSLTCAQQFAAVNQLAAPYRVAQAGVGGGLIAGGGAAAATTTSLLIAGGIIGGGLLIANNQDASGN